MNQRTASALAFGCSVAAAALAATTMVSNARAESPTIEPHPFVSMRSVADVRGETLAGRRTLSSAGNEWLSQQYGPMASSGLSRASVRSDYIAARDEVFARGSELGGPVTMAAPARRVPIASVTAERSATAR